ncbi:MAG: hypothetical protein MUF54_06930 [Polyangiaceae bacterium]|jgi:hypothetical protein|nr:hypothetical protein [Polyangiaceae bacterium]
MLRKRFLLVMLGVVMILSGAPSALAAPSEKDNPEAKAHLIAGVRHLEEMAWTDAVTELEASLALQDTPSVRYNLAKALAALGKLVEARAHLQIVIDNQLAAPWHRVRARNLLKLVQKRLAYVIIEVPEGFTGDVSVNGDTLPVSLWGRPREVNPGTTVVRALGEGFRLVEQTVVVEERERRRIQLNLQPKRESAPATASRTTPTPAPRPTTKQKSNVETTATGSTRRTLGYVSIAVGGVGLVAGTAFGLAARIARRDLSSACVNDVCTENQRDVYDRGKLQANASTAGFIVGGVGLGLGVLLLWTGPSEQQAEAKAGLGPFVGPGSAGVHGRF